METKRTLCQPQLSRKSFDLGVRGGERVNELLRLIGVRMEPRPESGWSDAKDEAGTGDLLRASGGCG